MKKIIMTIMIIIAKIIWITIIWIIEIWNVIGKSRLQSVITQNVVCYMSNSLTGSFWTGSKEKVICSEKTVLALRKQSRLYWGVTLLHVETTWPCVDRIVLEESISVWAIVDIQLDNWSYIPSSSVCNINIAWIQGCWLGFCIK